MSRLLQKVTEDRPVAIKRATVTGVVFTYNSAGPLLRKVLESIRWVDELIVVDMESKDGTAHLCLEYANRFLVHNENENINANYNFGHGQASCDYVLHIESDYIVPPELRSEILKVLSDEKRTDIYEIGVVTYFFGKPVQLSVWEKKKRPLLFKKGMVQYPTYRLEIWPTLLSSRKRLLKSKILHYTVERISDLVRKYNRYSDIEVRNNPSVIPLIKNPLVLATLGILYGLYDYLFRGGFRYGMHGLIVCFMQGFYFFLQRAKRWELEWKKQYGIPWDRDLQP